ncbi:hypothetical protein [Rariglobus hedericola]|uniref:Transglutaminase domain-containing protein n=1 Tax=Rariglobus hedericola TaxID=2597822 RepID=A0A556QMY9_9BACT|nr:hypothetical protein [Rariglobus hedericola]TSJ77987.1 hypothetical protein FPL22_01360 [Rariglobus hedericola]
MRVFTRLPVSRFCLRLIWWLCLVACVAQGRAALNTDLPDDWFTRAPTPERLKAVQSSAVSSGWSAVSNRLFAGAIRAYELRQEDAAAAWYHVARWCDVFAQSQSKSGRQWLEALNQVGGIHGNIDQVKIFSLPDEEIAQLLSAETRGWLLGDKAFSESFFNLLTPYDCLPQVMRIVQTLRDSDARLFSEYSQLAIAIALVYDESPPSYWPHWQVSEKTLPRRLPAPLDAFKFLVDADQRRVTLQKLGQLSAGELKFVVDLAAPATELAWAQRTVKFPLADLVKSYESVRYRHDRIDAREYVWTGASYDLEEIRREGGICVDQAYYATQAGKARGVPTLLFSGAGQDGRHAWFGYLGIGRQWVLDAGRYAEQRYVTGVAYDPQTWLELSDHELGFLSEGFRRLSPYRQSWQHQVFAELYLRMHKPAAAAVAARKAVNYERRNLAAWDLLLDASEGAPARTREGLLIEAAQAMQRYPDLNGRYVRALVASLRERGEISAADLEERTLLRRSRGGGRTDMGVDQAVAVMAKSSPADDTRTYRQVLQQYGRGAGVDFYDRVTEPFVAKLITEERKVEAAQIIVQTRAVLKPDAGSQLDLEMKDLADTTK